MEVSKAWHGVEPVAQKAAATETIAQPWRLAQGFFVRLKAYFLKARRGVARRSAASALMSLLLLVAAPPFDHSPRLASNGPQAAPCATLTHNAHWMSDHHLDAVAAVMRCGRGCKLAETTSVRQASHRSNTPRSAASPTRRVAAVAAMDRQNVIDSRRCMTMPE